MHSGRMAELATNSQNQYLTKTEVLGDGQCGSSRHSAKNRFRLHFEGFVRSKDGNIFVSA